MKRVDVEPLFMSPNWHWQADLELRLTQTTRGTRLSRNRHTGPLYVQKPFYPEGPDCAHIYVLHPPGGLVSGDTLTLDIHLEERTSALVTTPGAGRMYKARIDSPPQQQHTHLYVGEGASLEWFPMEAIVYNGAAAELSTSITLEDDASFMAWEITCFGLAASDEPFQDGHFTQRYRVEKKGLPLFVDTLRYDAKNTQLFTSKAGMQSLPVSGFFVAGPFKCTVDQKEFLSEGMRALINSASSLEDDDLSQHLAVTWVDDICILRYLGKSAYTCRKVFALLWTVLRPELTNREACEPRIWLT